MAVQEATPPDLERQLVKLLRKKGSYKVSKVNIHGPKASLAGARLETPRRYGGLTKRSHRC